MADVNANIDINISAADALAQLKILQRQLSQFNTSVLKSNATVIKAQKDLQQDLINNINATGRFSAELRNVRTSTETFTNALEKNKLSMREYFRFGVGASKTFGRAFKSEFDTINKVARERVKDLQTQYIKLGRDASGAMKAIAIRPAVLDMENFTTQQMIAAQRQQIFNQLLRQGTTNLLNFGKNTQWAGRQLMVGFTIPLSIFGATASRVFMDLEKEAIKFRKVYGDLFTLPQETDFVLNTLKELSLEFTKYGVAVRDTMAMASEAAAAGFSGSALTGQVEQATKLSILGQVEQQKALETTIALQNSFKMSNEELAESINFLNAVENQTVVSLDDISTAIPKVSPVIMQLGGDVRDLAFFMAAMKEGGINASEGANALKSGLASLINPTEKAADMLKTMGIDVVGIVEKNQGNLRQTVIEFAQALDTLDPLNRARAIEQLFGKFQFARLSTLFDNVASSGNQASRVLDLASASAQELARVSSRELSLVEESVTNRFLGAVERLRIAIAPIGEDFLRAITPVVELVTKIANKFSELPENVKSAITVLTAVIGGIGPVLLMTFGLLANGLANIVKGIQVLRNGYLRLTGQSNILGLSTEYMTQEQLNAMAAASSLEQVHAGLTQQFSVEKTAVDQLVSAYRAATSASQQFAGAFPGSMRPRTRYAKGVVSVPGTGNQDTVPAMLTPGEAVIPKAMAKKYAPLISAMVSGSIPGYQEGTLGSASRFTVGQSNVEISVFSQRSADAINRRINAASNLGAEALEDMARVLSSFADKTSVTVAEIDQELRGIPSLASVAAPEKYSAPTFIQRQSREMDWTTKQSEINVIQQQVAEKWPQIASDTEKMRNLTNTQASHIEKINANGENVEKDWTNLANLTPDLGAVNNYLNRVQRINVSAEDIDRIMRETNLDFNTVNAEVEKLKMGMHPVTKESASVLLSISRLDEQLSLAALEAGEVRTRLNTISETGYQATGAAATLSQRIDSDFYDTINNRTYRPAARVGSEATRAVGVGARTESPSEATRRTGQDVANGLIIGMQEKMDDVSVTGQQLGQAATTGVATSQQRRGRRVAARAQGPAEARLTYNPQAAAPAGAKILPLVGRPTEEFSDKLNDAAEQTEKYSRKINKAMFAISGVTTALSFMGGPIGEIAQQSLMFVFAFQAIIPLITSLIGKVGGVSKLLGLLTNPLGLAIAAIGGLAFLFFKLKADQEKQRKELFDSTQKLIEAQNSSARATEGYAAFIGEDLLPSAKEFLRINNKLSDANKELVQTFSDYYAEEFETATGAKSTRGAFIQQAYQRGGRATAATAVSADIARRAAIFGLSPEEIAANVRAAAELAGDAQLAIPVIAQLKGMFGPDGENILDKPLTVQSRIQFLQRDIQKATRELASMQIKSVKQAQKALAAEAAAVTTYSVGGISLPSVQTPQQPFNMSALGETEAVEKTTVSIEDAAKVSSIASRAIDSLRQGIAILNNEFATGAINQEEYNNQFAILSKQAFNLEKQIKNNLLPAFESIDESTKKLMVGEMLSAGMIEFKLKNPEQFQEILNNVNSLRDEDVTSTLIIQSQKGGLSPFEVNELAVRLKDIDESDPVVSIDVNGLSELAAAIAMLVVAEEQFERAVNMADIYGQRNAAVAAGAQRRRIDELAKIRQRLLDEIDPKDITPTGEDTKRIATPYDEILKRLKLVRDASINAYGGLKELLRVAGQGKKINIFDGIEQQLNTLSVSDEFIQWASGLDEETRPKFIRIKNGIVSLTEAGKAMNKALNEASLGDFQRSLQRGIRDVNMQQEAFKKLVANGLSVENALEIIKDQQVATAIATAANSKEVAKLIDLYNRLQTATVNLEQLDPIARFEAAFDLASRDFQIQEQQARLFYEPLISQADEAVKAIQKEIEDKQDEISSIQDAIERDFDRPIELLQREATVIGNDLSLLDRAAEAINARYDAQEDALNRILDINKDINAEQKSRLDLADAITRGDISAAAQAAQAARQQQQETQRNAMQKAMEAAREKELSAVVSSRGMSRSQIEQRQFDIQQEIFRLEQQRIPSLDTIKNIEDDIASIQNGRLKAAQENLASYQASLDNALKTVADQRLEWERAQLAIDKAKIEAEKAESSFDKNKILVESIQKAWDSIVDKNVTLTVTEIRNIITSSATTSSAKTGGGAAGMRFMGYGGKIKKMASGGFVSGIGMTDKVPTMLTPGEFVVNKAATQRFAPMLNAINSTKFPQMASRVGLSGTISTENVGSMYNSYEVNVNVPNSNATPEDIARVVMKEIQNINNQSIRRQKF